MVNLKTKVKLSRDSIKVAYYPKRKHRHHPYRKTSLGSLSACRAFRSKKKIAIGKRRIFRLCLKKWSTANYSKRNYKRRPLKFRMLIPKTASPENKKLLRSPITILPTVKRFFWVADSNIKLESELVIQAHQFVNDAGESANELISFGASGYTNLFINAVLQEGELYNISPQNLTIQPTGQTIISGTPIIIESVGFVAQYSSN